MFTPRYFPDAYFGAYWPPVASGGATVVASQGTQTGSVAATTVVSAGGVIIIRRGNPSGMPRLVSPFEPSKPIEFPVPLPPSLATVATTQPSQFGRLTALHDDDELEYLWMELAA